MALFRGRCGSIAQFFHLDSTRFTARTPSPFLPSPPSCTLPDIFRYSITATQDIAGERGRVRCRKNVINRTPSSPLSCCSRCGCTRGTGLLYIRVFDTIPSRLHACASRYIYKYTYIRIYICISMRARSLSECLGARLIGKNREIRVSVRAD